MGQAERIERLAGQLAALDVPGEPGSADPPSHQLAYDLTEIEDQCRTLADRVEALRESGDTAAWDEIREDVAHLLYHLRSPALADLASRVER